MAWGEFYGDPPLLLSPPQHWCRPGSSSRFPLMWLSTSPPLEYCSYPCNALLSSLPGSLCPVKLDRPVSRPPKQSPLHPAPPALSWELTSGAKVSVPSPHPGVSIFGDCARSSDGPFGSRSSFQNSNLMLHSSLHLEIPPLHLIFPMSRWLSRVHDPFLLQSSLSGVPVHLRFTFSHSPLFSCFT